MPKEKRIVTTPSLFEIDESFDDERFMKIRVCAMHSGVNENQSRFSVETIVEAKDTFKNIPILAKVQEYTDENGNQYLDYMSHEMHMENDFFNQGEDRLIYDEVCVGIVPETNNFELIHDPDTDRFYVYVDALLYRDYGNYVCDILKTRGGKTDVSMEIICDDIAYDEGGIINVTKMKASGCTLLSADTLPGMQGANATIVFSSDENKRQEQLLKIMQEIKFSLDNYISAHSEEKNIARKEETLMDNENKLEEPVVLENDETTVTENADTQHEVENTTLENEATVTEGATTQEDENANDTDNTAVLENEATVVAENTENGNENETNNQFTVSFDLSHDDIRMALFRLIYDAYPGEDLDIVQVFYDRFIMSDWNKPGCFWAQNYLYDDKGVSLVGYRFQVFAEFITEAEKDALELMRTTYASMESELNKYRNIASRNEKIEKVQNSDDYSAIKDSDEFKELMSKMDEYSIEDLTTKADLLLAKYAKSTKMFASVEEDEHKTTTHVINLSSTLGDESTKKKPYGGIFEDYFKRKNKRN